MVLRKMGNTVTPTIHLEKNGDEYSYHTVSTFKTTVIKFKLGEEFDEVRKYLTGSNPQRHDLRFVPFQETLDGRKVKSVFTLNGNVLTQVQKTEKKSELIRTFSETEMIAECVYGDVTCKRWYKVVA